MKKKALACGIIATTLALGIGLSGCSLISTNSEKNIDLVIANVDITEAEKFDEDNEFYEYKENELITEESTEIYKRDLIAYFLNAGYSYVQSGMSYRQTFNSLVESLTQTEILYQYATFYLLDYIRDYNNDSVSNVTSYYLNAELPSEYEEYMGKNGSFSEDSIKAIYILDNVYGILNSKYIDSKSDDSPVILTEEDVPNRVLLATYSLYSSLNASLDSYESALFEDEDETTGSGSRTTPENVDTEKENFYPVDGNGKLDYGIYTGYGEYDMAHSGTYREDRLDNSTRATRKSAYNSFIETLKANYLLSEDESYDDILALQYMEDEMTNQLKEQVIEQFYMIYELEQQEIISDDDYLTEAYCEMYKIQETTLSDTASFGTALGSMGDDSFVLYAPSTKKEGGGKYGFVYNILLPFSSSQSIILNQLSDWLSNDVISYNEYYIARNELLEGITTTDQRDAWFNGSTDYSFEASKYFDYGEGDYYKSTLDNAEINEDYLFFENNLTKTDRYETLDKYYGRYAYNGSVYAADDDSYILFPNELTIDDMLDEFSGYIDYVLGVGDDEESKVTVTNLSEYGDGSSDYYYTNTEFMSDKFRSEHTVGDTVEYDPMDLTADDIDYTKFIYAYGSVNFGTEEFSISDLVNPETEHYKVMSAVNELQYAYTTDTSVLSEYVGYTVNAGTTSYIKEFEKAAQMAISGGEFTVGASGSAQTITIGGGVGTFIVCAGDYGWHLIYVTAVFDNECDGDGYAIYGMPEDGKSEEELAQYWADFWKDKHTEGTFANLFYEFIKEIELESVTDNLRTNLLADFCDDDSIVLIEKNYKDLLNMG